MSLKTTGATHFKTSSRNPYGISGNVVNFGNASRPGDAATFDPHPLQPHKAGVRFLLAVLVCLTIGCARRGTQADRAYVSGGIEERTGHYFAVSCLRLKRAPSQRELLPTTAIQAKRDGHFRCFLSALVSGPMTGRVLCGAVV